MIVLLGAPLAAVSALSSGADTGDSSGGGDSSSSSAASSAAPIALSSSSVSSTAAPVSSSSAGITSAPLGSSSSSSTGSAAPAGPVLSLSPFTLLPASSSWTARVDFGAAQCGNRTLLFGGQTTAQVPLNDVHSSVQGASGLQWTQLPAAPWTPRFGSAVTAINSTTVLMTAGGATDSYPAELWSVDCSDDASPPRWTALQLGVTAWPARKLAASVLWRGELVLLGGSGARVITLSDIYTMDLQTLAWTARPDAGWTPRFALQAAVLADRLFVCGGNMSPGYLNDLWSLSDWSAQWVQLPLAPFSRRLYMSSIVLSSATLAGAWARSAVTAAQTQSQSQAASVWLLSGGADYSHPAAYNSVYAFDGSQWTREADAQWAPRYGAQMVPLSNATLLMLGGSSEEAGLNDCWSASFSVSGGASGPTGASSSSSTGISPQPAVSSSSTGPAPLSSSSTGPAPAPAPFVPSAGPSLPLSAFVLLSSAPSWSPRSGFGAVQCGSNVLVLGGFSVSSPFWLNEVHALNPEAGSWSQLASAPWTGRDQFAVSRINGTAIVLTGGASESGLLNDVWAASCAGASAPQWFLLSASAPFSPRFAHATVMWGTQLVLLGGSASSTLAGLNDVWTLDLSAASAQWVAQPLAPWSARQSFAAAVLGSALIVSGGVSLQPPFAPAYLNDVWLLRSAGSDWSASAWTELAPASFSPRSYLASAVLNATEWFVCGGQSFNDSVATDPYYRFNGSWSAQPMPAWGARQGSRLVELTVSAGLRSTADSATYPRALLLIGGSDSEAVPHSDVWAAYLGPVPAAASSGGSSGFRWSSAGGVFAILLIISAILAVPAVGLYCWRRRSAGRAHMDYTRDYSHADQSLDAPILAAPRARPVY